MRSRRPRRSRRSVIQDLPQHELLAVRPVGLRGVPEHSRPSPRGEYEVTDAVQYVIDVLGEPFEVVKSDEPVLDMSSRGDIGSVERMLSRQVLSF